MKFACTCSHFLFPMSRVLQLHLCVKIESEHTAASGCALRGWPLSDIPSSSGVSRSGAFLPIQHCGDILPRCACCAFSLRLWPHAWGCLDVPGECEVAHGLYSSCCSELTVGQSPASQPSRVPAHGEDRVSHSAQRHPWQEQDPLARGAFSHHRPLGSRSRERTPLCPHEALRQLWTGLAGSPGAIAEAPAMSSVPLETSLPQVGPQ